MADNTSSYAANIAVRAFLTEFTGYYLNEVFGHDLSDGSYTRGGKIGVKKYGKKEWENIKKKFGGNVHIADKKRARPKN